MGLSLCKENNDIELEHIVDYKQIEKLEDEYERLILDEFSTLSPKKGVIESLHSLKKEGYNVTGAAYPLLWSGISAVTPAVTARCKGNGHADGDLDGTHPRPLAG